jgi:PAS domain S-box-containing protein
MDRPDDLLWAVVEHLPIGVLALDAEGRVLLWNAYAEWLTGWKRERVLGRSGLEDVRVDTAPGRRVLDELRAGRPCAGRLPATAPSGMPIYFRAVPTPCLPGAAAVAILQDVQDVQDVRADDEAFALLDALWESTPVGLAYFDTDLRYRRVNGAVLDIDGGTADQRIGRTPEEVHGATGALVVAQLRAVLSHGRARVDVPIQGRLWHGRGPFQEWRLNCYPVRGPAGLPLGVGVVLVDVTAAERTRRQLAAVAAEREHALTRFQSLVEATSAAVWTRTATGEAVEDAPALRAITGQTLQQYRGWGFLDAVHTDDRECVRAAWRAAVEADPATVFTGTHRLRTATDGYRWFRTRAVPVRTGGAVSEWVGTETDIDDEVRARHRLDVLARATLAVNAALDPEAELTALAEAVVPEFADLCRVYLVDPVPAGAGTGPLIGRRSLTRSAPGIPASPASADRFVFPAHHPVTRSVWSRTPVRSDFPPPPGQWHGSPELYRWNEEVGANSMLVAPVVSRGTAIAALLFMSCRDRPRYTDDDLALVGELAGRASTAVEHAREFQQSRQVSLALQSAMLTEPPRYPGLEIEARYVAAVAELEVGGDWYDAFVLPGGDLAVGVGDVAGHDLPAAAVMGQLRSMLRALAYDSDADPSEVLDRLDRVASRLDVTRFTTLIYGRISRERGRTRFRWANAGHPVPLLVGPDGRPRAVPGDVGVVLGVDPGAERIDQEIVLEPGSTLLLHTDGLVERRRDPADRAGSDLLDLVRSAAGLPLPDFCDHLIRGTAADTGDDMVVLAVRLAR